ncbi:MAG: RES family NAD+ phosphorylase [Bacteroidota bacterium]
MEVFRITKEKYKADLSGKGAELFGGRWNPVGCPALYTSESRALCALEILVHTSKDFLPPKYIIQTIHIPRKLEKEIAHIASKNLPANWDLIQHDESTEELGLRYFKEKNKLGIKVPSVIIQQESNIILNPLHPLYHKVKIIGTTGFHIDRRLIK